MDYTTLARVKQSLHASAPADDALLGKIITAASRAFDRKCTGAMDAVDYFALADVSNERLQGQIDFTGAVYCYPRKPVIVSVADFDYQQNITTQLFSVDTSRIEVSGPQVIAYPTSMIVPQPAKCRINISYRGGLGATVADLPEDFQELVALLAIRFYREEESGLSDAIGVAELATMIYTKAWPVRVLEQMAPYVRRVGYRHVA